MFNRKQILFLTTLVIILVTSFVVIIINYNPNQLSKDDTKKAIDQAQSIYRSEKERGRDFSEGPCLSDSLMPGWVVDIVHNPRQSIDDLPQNQCPSYLSGRASHFVELDTEGNFVRAK